MFPLQWISFFHFSDPPDLTPIQEIDRDLCDLEKLRTVEKLVDDLSVALSQHFPRMWSCEPFIKYFVIKINQLFFSNLFSCVLNLKSLFADLSSPVLHSKTAHPKLEISQDGRQVYWRRQPISDPPNTNPYDSQYSVLAQESFTAGQHYWEVIVQEKPFWLIGVTTGAAAKKEGSSQTQPNLGVNKTSWCIYHGEGKYLACHDTQEKQLSVEKKVRKLGILANLQKGELSFYNGDTSTLLHSFFVECKEPLYPMFNPCIDVKGLNRQPLTLFCIKDPWNN